jgi:hypothetical protein
VGNWMDGKVMENLIEMKDGYAGMMADGPGLM